MNELRVCISVGNKKMGKIRSVSFPAVTTCNPEAPCFKKCYAKRISNVRKSVRESYERNYKIYREHPDVFWKQVELAMCCSRNFRFNVSGDIPDESFLKGIVRCAKNVPYCETLVFTKQYNIVNNFVKDYGIKNIPKNLHIIFSLWNSEWNAKTKNPYKFPEAKVIFKGETYKGLTCSGNCTNCFITNSGCWNLKRGETIGLFEH